jgi:signal transduction histidine kinase
MAIGMRAEEIHQRAITIVYPQGEDKEASDAYLQLRWARTLVGTLLIARWLITGIGTDREEMEWVTNSGTMAAREGVSIVITTRAFHVWRDLLIEVAREEAARLGTPADVLEEAVQITRRSCDASLVRIADAYDTQLRASNAQLERASQFKSEFLAKMSHELRTPLTAVIGFCEVLIGGMDGDLNPDQAEDTREVLRSALSMLELVNEILDLSKIEAGRLEMVIEVVDLAASADQVIATLHQLAEAKALTLTSEVPPAARSVKGDPDRVRQVITNLVSNAIKFTSAGSVAIRAKPVGAMVEVSVVDTGIGIAADAQERIFQEFRQADDKTSQRYGGTGLGLSIARKLVELQGGHMGVASKPGEGSRFWFTLPLSVGALEPQR